jgi:hypothetical protein
VRHLWRRCSDDQQHCPQGGADLPPQTGTGALTVTSSGSACATWTGSNADNQGAALDCDHDGVPNGVEYFMGRTGSSFTANPTLDSNRQITWPKDPGGNASYVVQTSTIQHLSLIHKDTTGMW